MISAGKNLELGGIMMAAPKQFWLVAFILAGLLAGCAQKQASQPVHDNSVTKVAAAKPEPTAQTITPVPKPVEEPGKEPSQGHTQQLEQALRELKGMLSTIGDTNRSTDERSQALESFLKGVESFLQSEGSMAYSDQDLSQKLDQQIVVKTKVENGTSFRIVHYAGLPELLGTLERNWTFVQWKDANGKVHAQTLIEQGAEITNDFVVTKAKDGLFIGLTGYLTVEKPHPVFLATWTLREEQWQPRAIPNLTQPEGWSVEVTDNEASFQADGEMFVEVSDADKTIHISQDEAGKRITLSFRTGEVMLQKP
jgi:hypothetical protein